MTTLQAAMADLGVLPSGFSEECVGAKFHSPTPRVTRVYDLAQGAGLVDEGDAAKDPVRLCAVCHDNLIIFLMLVRGGCDWEVKRQFGNRIRGLAKRVAADGGGA